MQKMISCIGGRNSPNAGRELLQRPRCEEWEGAGDRGDLTDIFE